MIERRLLSSPRPFVLDSWPRTQARVVSLALGLALALTLTLTLTLTLAACSPTGPRDYEGHGKAVEVDLAKRTVTLDHEDIPGLMKGMTMTFAVAPDVELDSIAAGSDVDFVLRNADDALTVTKIEPLPD